MDIIFWQNTISIHQSAFIRALSQFAHVILVVEKRINEERVKEGWNIPRLNIAIIISPTKKEIVRLIKKKETYHIFSGIDFNQMVYTAFKLAIRNQCRISVMMEPYKWMGIKGKLRQFKYKWLFMRYGDRINILFVTGYQAEKCYVKSGFLKEKIFQWGYFTEEKVESVIDRRDRRKGEKPNIIFIGKIDKRKNILNLVDVAKKNKCLFNKFFIIGQGDLESQLIERIKSENYINYLHTIPNNQIPFYLDKSDLLILPSIFDGWGAVVNEALMRGTRVLCSENCGAASLLDGNIRGGIFKIDNDNKDLCMQLQKWLNKGLVTLEQREDIKKWSKMNISGEAVAQYFYSVLINPDKNIIAPWIKN